MIINLLRRLWGAEKALAHYADRKNWHTDWYRIDAYTMHNNALVAYHASDDGTRIARAYFEKQSNKRRI